MNKYKALSPNAKNVAKALLGLAILLLVFGVFSLLTGEKKVEVLVDKPLLNKDFVNESDEALSEKIMLQREIKSINDRMTIELEALRKENEKMRQQNDALSDSISSGVLTPAVPANNASYPPSPTPMGESNYPSGAYSQPPQQIKVESVGGIRRITAPAETLPSKTAVKSKINYFPTTTLLRGTTLNGLYAPTLSKGKGTPQPIIIRINDLSSLPNKLQRNIEGCRLLGEAYGELSDSRVHIRLTKLACTGLDGSAYIDNAVKGVVFGEDGTLGIPGQVVANFNKLLLHSFFMESLAGLGGAIQSFTTTSVVSADGNTVSSIEGGSSERAGKILLSAGGEGLGKGFDRIASFYLEMLNDMTPVVQINGGREVEITFTEGIELELQGNDWTWEDILE